MARRHKSSWAVSVAGAVICLLVAVHSVCAQGTLQVVAQSGGASPDGNGHLSGFVYRGNEQFPNFIHEYRAPVVNDRGEVAFWAAMAETMGAYSTDTALVVGSPGHLQVAARIGDVLADGSTILGQLGQPTIDPEGGTWFATTVSGAPVDGHEHIGLIHATGAGPDLAFYTPVPSSVGSGSVQFITQPTANGNGAVALMTTTLDASQSYYDSIDVW
jgi:hypothetical protein